MARPAVRPAGAAGVPGRGDCGRLIVMSDLSRSTRLRLHHCSRLITSSRTNDATSMTTAIAVAPA